MGVEEYKADITDIFWQQLYFILDRTSTIKISTEPRMPTCRSYFSFLTSADAKPQMLKCPVRVLDNLAQTASLQLRACLPTHGVSLTSPERVKFGLVHFFFTYL